MRQRPDVGGPPEGEPAVGGRVAGDRVAVAGPLEWAGPSFPQFSTIVRMQMHINRLVTGTIGIGVAMGRLNR